MKIKFYYLSLLLFLFMPTPAFSSTLSDLLQGEATKLETYLAGREHLIISDIYSAGELKELGTVFEAVITHTPDMSSKVAGMQVYSREGQERQYYYAYVDEDEMDGLLKAVTSMIDLQNNQPLGHGESRRRIVYACKGNFMVELQSSASKQRIFIGGRSMSIMLEKANLTSLREILENVQDILKKHKTIVSTDDKK